MSNNPEVIYQAAEFILGCVCGRMSEISQDLDNYSGCPCRAYVSPGSPAFDDCCDSCSGDEAGGQLTVHVEDVFTSDNFPSRTTVIFPCRPASYVGTFVVTVARCVPTMDEKGDPPTPQEMDAASRKIMIDQQAVLDALSCCLPDFPPAGKRKRRASLAGFRVIPESGGCMGFEVRINVDLGAICSCGNES